jgi:hypothetical protein
MSFDLIDTLKNSFVLLFTDPLIFGLAVLSAVISILFDTYYTNSLNIANSAVYASNYITINAIKLMPQNNFSLYFLLISFILVFLAGVFISDLVFIRIGEKKQNLGKILKRAVKRYPALLATTVLSSLIILAGFIAFIIPGIFLLFKLILSPVSSVVENKSPVDSIKRSWEITVGNWWYLFAFFLIISIIITILDLLPYISSFFSFVLIISYPLIFMAIKKNKRAVKRRIA